MRAGWQCEHLMFFVRVSGYQSVLQHFLRRVRDTARLHSTPATMHGALSRLLHTLVRVPHRMFPYSSCQPTARQDPTACQGPNECALCLQPARALLYYRLGDCLRQVRPKATFKNHPFVFIFDVAVQLYIKKGIQAFFCRPASEHIHKTHASGLHFICMVKECCT